MPLKDRDAYNEYRRKWRASKPKHPRSDQPVMVQRPIGFLPAQLATIDSLAAEANISRAAMVRTLVNEAVLARARA